MTYGHFTLSPAKKNPALISEKRDFWGKPRKLLENGYVFTGADIVENLRPHGYAHLAQMGGAQQVHLGPGLPDAAADADDEKCRDVLHQGAGLTLFARQIHSKNCTIASDESQYLITIQITIQDLTPSIDTPHK